jgi:hypothetical protein
VWWKIFSVLTAVKYLSMKPAAMRGKKNRRHLDYERLFLSALPIPSVCSYESSPYWVVLSSLVVGNCDVKILIYLPNKCTFVGQIY